MKTFPVWTCKECGKSEVGTAHQMKKKYCSAACVSSVYKRDLKGTANPNYRQNCQKACKACGSAFTTYTSGKYCSHKCYHESRKTLEDRSCKFCSKPFHPNHGGQAFCSNDCRKKSKPLVGYVKKGRPARQQGTCPVCQSSFKYSLSTNRIYCSYQCHIKSGGAQRAGNASIKARMKYGAKKDANHTEIITVISSMVAVKDFSSMGFGIPDGIAWIKDAWHFFDIKNPKTAYGRRGLNPIQKKWATGWSGGPVYLIYTKEDAENFSLGKFDLVKKFQ